MKKPEVTSIPVTPEMLEAGQTVLRRRGIEVSDDVLVLVYAAMSAKKPK